jgi:predicted alpha/beta-hydrolase family hydrolase
MDSVTTVERYESTGVRGFLHRPDGAAQHGLVLAHGAGTDCNAPLLIEVAKAFAAAGVSVLRCDLPFRQRRRAGPPSPATAAEDRAGLAEAVAAMREIAPGRLFLGGHSYGGRQATMLATDRPEIADRLLLFSYPLHPPKKPEQLRTAHFPLVRLPAIFVHGERDGFGSVEELRAAVSAIPGRVEIIPVAGAGHDLRRGRIDFAPVLASLLRPPSP